MKTIAYLFAVVAGTGCGKTISDANKSLAPPRHEERKRTSARIGLPVARLPTAKDVTLNAVADRQRIMGGRGDVDGIRLRVGPAGGCAPLSIGEQYSGGAGPLIRASLWSAVTTAAALVGRSANDYCVHVDLHHHVDGPSAGALFTAGLMAAMAGYAVRDDVTITGSMGPNGTIGAVGGIGGKLSAAVRANLREFGLPSGARYGVDPMSGKREDLDRLARAKIALKRLETVQDALLLLTGRRVPEPAPLEANAMAVPKKAVRAALSLGNQLVQAAERSCRQARANIAKGGHAALDAIEKLTRDAEVLLEQGRGGLNESAFADGVSDAARSAAECMAAEEMSKHLQGTADEKTALLALQGIVERKIREAGERLRTIHGTTTMTAKGIFVAVEQLTSWIGGMTEMERARRVLAMLTNSAKTAQRNRTQAAELGSAARHCYAGIALLFRSGLLEPYFSTGDEMFLVHEKSLEYAARALAVEAEARGTYRRALRQSSRKRFTGVECPEEREGEETVWDRLQLSELFVKEGQAAWQHLFLLATARDAIRSTMVHVSEDEDLRRAARVAERAARVFAALSKAKGGGVPLASLHHFQKGRSEFAAGRFGAARREFDSSIIGARIAVLLATDNETHFNAEDVSQPSKGKVPAVEF